MPNQQILQNKKIQNTFGNRGILAPLSGTLVGMARLPKIRNLGKKFILELFHTNGRKLTTRGCAALDAAISVIIDCAINYMIF